MCSVSLFTSLGVGGRQGPTSSLYAIHGHFKEPRTFLRVPVSPIETGASVCITRAFVEQQAQDYLNDPGAQVALTPASQKSRLEVKAQLFLALRLPICFMSVLKPRVAPAVKKTHTHSCHQPQETSANHFELSKFKNNPAKARQITGIPQSLPSPASWQGSQEA